MWFLCFILFLALVQSTETDNTEELIIVIAIIVFLIFYKIILPFQEKKAKKNAQIAQQQENIRQRELEQGQIIDELKSGRLLKSCEEVIQAYYDFFQNTDFDILKSKVYVVIIIPDSFSGKTVAISDIYNDDYRLRYLMDGSLGLYVLDGKTEYFKNTKVAERCKAGEHIQFSSSDMEEFLREHGVSELLFDHGLAISQLREDVFRLTAKIYGVEGIYGTYHCFNHNERLEILKNLLRKKFSNLDIHIEVFSQIY